MSIFTKTNLRRPPESTFDLSHDNKFSTNPGMLTPILVQDCLPGDLFKIKTSLLVRFAPLVAPIMHQVQANMEFYFVPNRIMWNNWEDFITGGEDGEDVSVFPKIRYSVPPPDHNPSEDDVYATRGSLLDYLGYQPASLSVETSEFSALPFYAYWLIYDEYYRDQNIQEKMLPQIFSSTDGELQDGVNIPDTGGFCARRAWQHDYFTSALPEPQKGPAATIPLGDTATLERVDNEDADINFTSTLVSPSQLHVAAPPYGTSPTDEALKTEAISGDLANPDGSVKYGVDSSANYKINLQNIVANLSTATAALITDLRRAFRLQEWLEKNARGGSRYFESNMVHFGVKSPDARLNRPEFIGSIKQPVQVSEVLQTSSTDGTSPQGNMSGHAISASTGRTLRYYCQEHGYIIGLLTIRPKTAYYQGVQKHLFKFDKFDFGWPEFANIGEQAILNRELVNSHNDPDGIFGYIPRYAEYKYRNSEVHGDFKGSLRFWHWARMLDSNVALNSDFISCQPSNLPFAVTDDSHKLWCHVFFSMFAKRKLPYFGNPTI